MAHFAYIQKINPDSELYVVLDVIVAEQDYINSGAVGDPANWIQTSYNHRIRNVFAGKGYIYDKNMDMFLPPKPFPSWRLYEYYVNSLDEENNIISVKKYDWIAPVPSPNIPGDDTPYTWSEEEQKWVINPQWDEINRKYKE